MATNIPKKEKRWIKTREAAMNAKSLPNKSKGLKTSDLSINAVLIKPKYNLIL